MMHFVMYPYGFCFEPIQIILSLDHIHINVWSSITIDITKISDASVSKIVDIGSSPLDDVAYYASISLFSWLIFHFRYLALEE